MIGHIKNVCVRVLNSSSREREEVVVVVVVMMTGMGGRVKKPKASCKKPMKMSGDGGPPNHTCRWGLLTGGGLWAGRSPRRAASSRAQTSLRGRGGRQPSVNDFSEGCPLIADQSVVEICLLKQVTRNNSVTSGFLDQYSRHLLRINTRDV